MHSASVNPAAQEAPLCGSAVRHQDPDGSWHTEAVNYRFKFEASVALALRATSSSACDNVWAMSEGTVTWSAPFDDHPARRASRKSMELVAKREKEAWLNLYSEDAVIEDPVGPSPFDPQGAGHRGRDRMDAFWEGTIATTERLDFEITQSYVAGNEVANVGAVIAHLPGGVALKTAGVYVYRINSDGRINSLRAFWEFDRAMGTMTQGD
jgi:steroid Delta-isomerase